MVLGLSSHSSRRSRATEMFALYCCHRRGVECSLSQDDMEIVALTINSREQRNPCHKSLVVTALISGLVALHNRSSALDYDKRWLTVVGIPFLRLPSCSMVTEAPLPHNSFNRVAGLDAMSWHRHLDSHRGILRLMAGSLVKMMLLNIWQPGLLLWARWQLRPPQGLLRLFLHSRDHHRQQGRRDRLRARGLLRSCKRSNSSSNHSHSQSTSSAGIKHLKLRGSLRSTQTVICQFGPALSILLLPLEAHQQPVTVCLLPIVLSSL